jgi:hypothetical protein
VSAWDGESTQDDPIGPGTDLVISLFCTFLVLAVLGGALRLHTQRVLDGMAKQSRPTLPKAQTIVLDPVTDGLQYFERGSYAVSAELVGAIRTKLSPLKDNLVQAQGGLVIHVAGYASPEPLGEDQGGANFELALKRAMAIATLLHTELAIPFECLRVQGAGRGESPALREWLATHDGEGPSAWDREYRKRREEEKHGWQSGESEWEAAYTSGKTELGRLLGSERKVVLRTESADSAVCGRALADPVPPAPVDSKPASQVGSRRREPSPRRGTSYQRPANVELDDDEPRAAPTDPMPSTLGF